MKNFFKKHKWLVLFGILGAIAGYAYWHFVGCSSGSCAITSKWQNSTIYGTIIGLLIGDSFKKKKAEKEKQENQIEEA